MNPACQAFIDELHERDELLVRKVEQFYTLVNACDIVLEALLRTEADIGAQAEMEFLSKLRTAGCARMVDEFIDRKYRIEDCGSDPSEKDAVWEERE